MNITKLVRRLDRAKSIRAKLHVLSATPSDVVCLIIPPDNSQLVAQLWLTHEEIEILYEVSKTQTQQANQPPGPPTHP